MQKNEQKEGEIVKHEKILKAKKTDLIKNFKCIGKDSSRYVYDAGDGKFVIKYA